MRILHCFAALLPLALGACQMTAFGSLPQGASNDCPKPLVGAWLAQEEKRGEPSDFGIVVHADCTVESRSKGEKRPASGPLPQLSVLRQAGSDEIVLIGTAAAFDLADIKPTNADEKPGGYMAFAWKRDDITVELRGIDDRRVATLIVQGAIQGDAHAHQTNRQTEIENFVTEDAAGAARVLSTYDLFDARNPMRFRRVGDDAKALERSMRFATGGKRGKP